MSIENVPGHIRVSSGKYRGLTSTKKGAGSKWRPLADMFGVSVGTISKWAGSGVPESVDIERLRRVWPSHDWRKRN